MEVMYDGLLKVEINYEGAFFPKPLRYIGGLKKYYNDVDFSSFDFSELKAFIQRSVLDLDSHIYYCVPGQCLSNGLRKIEGDLEYVDFINHGYMHDGRIDLYLDYYHEPLFEWIASEELEEEIEIEQPEANDEIWDKRVGVEQVESDGFMSINELIAMDQQQINNKQTEENELHQHVDDHEIQLVDDDETRHVQYRAADEEQFVEETPIDHVLDSITIAPCDYTKNDPFLHKLCSRSVVNEPVDKPVDDDDTHCFDDDFYEEGSEYQIKKNVVYPVHDPDQEWNHMKPILGMRFESPADLKFMLANYGVNNGFQLGYKKNDFRFILCVCGEDARTRLVGKGKVAKGTPVKHCPFRLWASWMSKERSFQIKTLNPKHTCSRKFNMGALVTYVWIAKHFALDIIEDPHITIRALVDAVKNKFNIKVSRTQCSNAKIRALYDLEGGLVEHYARVRDYAHEILRSNPGSTVKLGVNVMPDETRYFSRLYVCYSGLRDGWKAGCRKIVGLDGCYLRGPVTGQLLSAVGRDANNQIFPIAWAVVCVENKDNWIWFMDLLMDDLETQRGRGLTIISDQHKGLVHACKNVAPSAVHRQCARHIYANFRKRFTGAQYHRLFWQAAFSSLEADFERKMNEIKAIDNTAYIHLMKTEPRSWCRAYQEENIACASVENGISESFNSCIVNARSKVMITMLEEIRVYVMQRLFLMKKEAMGLNDDICPSVRKQLELFNRSQRGWYVIQSAMNDFEVRNNQDSFHVNIDKKTCGCRMWQLTGIPCLHVVSVCGYLNIDPDQYVSHWYTKEKWLACYSHEMVPQYGSKYWKKVDGTPPLPPQGRKMPGRPKKKRIRHHTENQDGKESISRVGRTMTCTICCQSGHNKKSCNKETVAKPVRELRKPGRKKKVPDEKVGACTSSRGRGIPGGRGGTVLRGGSSRGGAILRGGSSRGGGGLRGGSSRGGAVLRGGSSRGGAILRGGSSRGGAVSRGGSKSKLVDEIWSSEEEWNGVKQVKKKGKQPLQSEPNSVEDEQVEKSDEEHEKQDEEANMVAPLKRRKKYERS